MQNTQILDGLLAKLSLLPFEAAQRIRERWETADEEGREALLRVLKETAGDQEEIVRKIVEADPAFPEKLNAFLKDQTQSLKADFARSDADALASLENQLDA